MLSTRIATRYARSLMSLAKEENSLDQTHEDMLMISNATHSSRELSLLLSSPVVKEDMKENILDKIFSGKVGALTLSFIRITVKKRRERFLDAIAKEFVRQYKAHKNIITAEVTSVIPLDEELRRQVIRKIQESTRSEIELVEKTDPLLIGGLVLRIGDRQVDNSIRRKLADVKRVIAG